MTRSSVSLPHPDIEQRKASDPVASVWVEASAGTGKTKVLTDRVLRLMLDGTPTHRILCLTFTRAAATQMALRIHRTLSEWATVDDSTLHLILTKLTGSAPSQEYLNTARRLFAMVMACPGGMNIQTIHSFCHSLLRRFSFEAGLPPHFQLMEDSTAIELLLKAQAQVFSNAQQQPQSRLKKAVDRLARLYQDPQQHTVLFDEIRQKRSTLRRLFHEHGGVKRSITKVYQSLGVSCRDDADLVQQACRHERATERDLNQVLPFLANGSSKDQERYHVIEQWLNANEEKRRLLFEEYKGIFLTEKDHIRKLLVTKEVKKVCPQIETILTDEATRLEDVQKRRKAAEVAALTEAWLIFSDSFLSLYEEMKQQQALLDYDDLLMITLTKLLGPSGSTSWVLYKLDGGLDHILIDEAQDITPQQWEIIARLTDEFFSSQEGRSSVRTVFSVGDAKQSIFSFQGVKQVKFAAMRRYFQERVETAQHCWRSVNLDISFRSTPAVLKCVDATFKEPQVHKGLLADDKPPSHHISFQSDKPGLVELWPVLIKKPSRDTPSLSDFPHLHRTENHAKTELAQIIAQTVKDWVGKEKLHIPNRLIRPGDILILVQRRTHFMDDLVRAFKEQDIPVAGVDRLVVTSQIVVMDMIVFAQFLLLPEDDLALATLLKSPVIGLSEETLFTVAHGRESTLWGSLRQNQHRDTKIAKVCQYLEEWLSRVDFITPYQLFSSILGLPCPNDEVSGWRAILSRLGHEVVDPLEELLNLSLDFTHSNPPSLQGFLAWLTFKEKSIKREHDQDSQSSDMVRLMTVHGAKGLQAPIVFVADTVSVPHHPIDILWSDDQREVPLFIQNKDSAYPVTKCKQVYQYLEDQRMQEYRRLLYVALTRAEERLYVCGWSSKDTLPPSCWYRLVEKGMKKEATARRFTVPLLNGEGWRLCDTVFGSSTSSDMEDQAQSSFLPLLDYPSWLRTPAPSEPHPPRPLTASQPEDEEPAVSSPIDAEDPYRYRRGVLIHHLLEMLPQHPYDQRYRVAADFVRATLPQLEVEQVTHLVEHVLQILDYPDFALLFAPGSRAEVPIIGQIKGRLVSAQVDRLVVTEDKVVIADYKTHRHPPLTEEALPVVYVKQMALYRLLVQQVYPTKTCHCMLIWTDGPVLMPLSSRLLDRHSP